MIKLSQINRPRMILFSVLALLTIYVLVNTELHFVLNKTPASERLKSMSLLLIPHVLFGSVALIIGPFQFSSNMRLKNIMLHRKLGKLYIISVLLSAPFAILLPFYYPIPGANNTFMFANITLVSAWAVSSLLAWISAARRQINLHKIWAARSYGLTFTFILSRVYDMSRLLSENPTINDFGFFLLFLTVAALILPDVFLFYKELFGLKKSRSRTQLKTNSLAPKQTAES